MLRIVISFVVAFAAAALGGKGLIPLLRRMKAGQSIKEIGPTWHNTKAGTPMMGGLMFIFGTILCLVGNFPAMSDNSPFYVLALSLCFGLIGFLDDFTKVKFHRNLGLTTLQKAMLQMAVSALFLYAMYRSGFMDTHLYIPFVNVSFQLHPIVYIFFAMFVMVGTDNAVNLTDGVDGLCASVTLPVMVFFTAASAAMGKYDLALLPAALTGGLAAYLFYNWHPAKVFMGDTGSLFLGGVVCAMAFALEMPLILILIGFVYVCEAMSDILQVSYFKATHGKRLFKMTPIHHAFEMRGWSEVKIDCVFSFIAFGAAALGVLFAYVYYL